MKKLSLIYKLSFLIYLAFEVFFSLNDFIDEYRHSFGNLVAIFNFLAILAFIYQLIYIIKLGRRDNVSGKKSIGQFFLYLFLVISVSILINYALIYFKGYTVYAFFAWSAPPSVYYGAEAWDRYNKSFHFPKQHLGISAVYAIIYFIVSIICKKRKEIDEQQETNGNIKETHKISFLTILPLLIMLLVIIFGVSAAKN